MAASFSRNAMAAMAFWCFASCLAGAGLAFAPAVGTRMRSTVPTAFPMFVLFVLFVWICDICAIWRS